MPGTLNIRSAMLRILSFSILTVHMVWTLDTMNETATSAITDTVKETWEADLKLSDSSSSVKAVLQHCHRRCEWVATNRCKTWSVWDVLEVRFTRTVIVAEVHCQWNTQDCHRHGQHHARLSQTLSATRETVTDTVGNTPDRHRHCRQLAVLV